MTTTEREVLDKMDLQRASELVKEAFAKKKQSLEKIWGDKLPEVLANLQHSQTK